MSNVWEALYQTLNVSLAAAVLLLVKWLLRDKLSPRWQYAVWAVLALRAFIPAGVVRGIIPQLSLWLETARSAAELHLNSAYTSAFDVIDMESVFPWIDAAPVSLTDWLFAVYAVGVAAALVWYAVSYARLRALLRRGREAGEDVRAAVDAVAEKYGLKACRTVAVPGLKGAFVCGIIRPVLAVPEGEAPDGKIILHELLHLKHLDALQNVFWCVLRALHWCNPFMQYVFDRVGNDMESLCDQRVLERLEGEERREYGAILLGMASSAYARAPGTSSISNGAKNIARRIEAIARFKLYPRGMALVSVCVVLILASALLTGASAEYDKYMNPRNPREVFPSLAAARIERCSTIPGAIDTYLNGFIFSDCGSLAMASPLSEQERLCSEYREKLDGDWAYPEVAFSMRPEIYSARVDSDGVFRANVVLSGGSFAYEPYFGEPDSDDMVYVMPIEVSYADGGYVVRSGGEPYWDDEYAYWYADAIPLYSASAETGVGTLTVCLNSMGTIDMEPYTYDDGSVVTADPGYTLSDASNPDAAWEDYYESSWSLTLELADYLAAHEDAQTVNVNYQWCGSAEEAREFFFSECAAYHASGGERYQGDDGGYGYDSVDRRRLAEDDYILRMDGHESWNYGLAPNAAPYYPAYAAVTIYIDGELAGEYVLEIREAAQ